MWFLIVFGVLLLLLGVLLMPFELEINSVSNLYELRVGKFLAGGLAIEEGKFEGYVRFFKWRRSFTSLPKRKKKKKQDKKEKKRRKRKIKHLFRRVLSVLQSFKVRKLYIDVDTGNYILNAYLYPLLFFIKRKIGHPVGINFSDRVVVQVLISNNLMRVAIAFFRYKK